MIIKSLIKPIAAACFTLSLFSSVSFAEMNDEDMQSSKDDMSEMRNKDMRGKKPAMSPQSDEQ